MSTKRYGLAALFALLTLALGFSGVAAAAPESPDDTTVTSSCTPRPIGSEEVSAEYVRTVDGSSEFSAYESVEFGFSLALSEGHCQGDSIEFTTPAELGSNGSPVDLTTDDGVVIARAVYADSKVSVTLTDAVENTAYYAFEAHAWWRASMRDTLIPGETRDLIWEIGGEIRRTQIHVAQCPGCSQPGTGPSKWGWVHPDSEKMSVTVVTPTATSVGQGFLIRDTLTSPGQHFNCPSPASQARVYSTAGVWGQPQYTRHIPVTVVECTSTAVTLSISLNTDEKARVDLSLSIDPDNPGPWTDTVTINSQEKSWERSATVRRAESGGGAGYLLRPTPTPTPSPSVTSEPTPSTTPEPSATPTPSPSTNTEPTPSPTPLVKPTSSPKRLATTGLSADSLAVCGILLTVGIIATWTSMSKRRR